MWSLEPTLINGAKPKSHTSRIKLKGVKMKTLIRQVVYLSLIGILSYGCVSTSGTTKTYISPSLASTKITSVAIFPLRNAFTQTNVSLGTGDMIDINQMFQSEFFKRNANTKLINSVESTELLNKGSLVDIYSDLITVYTVTGIPNTETLKLIGEQLEADVIIQGFVVRVVQRDGVFGGNRGETSVTVRYVMFSTITGEVLWEATSDGYKGTALTTEKAPPVTDVIEILREKIISALPELS